MYGERESTIYNVSSITDPNSIKYYILKLKTGTL